MQIANVVSEYRQNFILKIFKNSLDPKTEISFQKSTKIAVAVDI